MSSMPIRTTLAALSVLLVLSACGGGGGGDEQGGTGVFLDAPVAGLEYETATISGVTDAQGRFEYGAGEDVTFRVGDTILGTTRGKRTVTPLDLSPGAVAPTTNRELEEVVNESGSTPETRFVNLLVFLQTVDADGDPDNGIEIPQALAGLLAGVQIPFDMPIFEFSSSAKLRRLLRDGLQAGLWGGVGRPILLPARAIDHFYAQAGIVHAFERQRRYEYHEDNDQIPEEAYVITYGADDMFVEQQGDRDGDGIFEAFSRVTFNERGVYRTSFYDLDGMGATDRLEVRDLDENDDLIRYTTYENGALEGIRTYTLDALGLARLVDVDTNGDGAADERETLYRNAEGLQIRREVDRDMDGFADRIDTRTYHASGVRRTAAYDRDADGNPESTYTYDAQGRITRYEGDNDSDGTLNRIKTHVYDDAARTHTEYDDDDADGATDETHVTYFDEAGRRILYTRDTGADGTIDERTTYVYLPDRYVEERDEDNDGTTDRRFTVLLDAAGNPIELLEDEDADGSVDWRQVIEWEPGSAFSGGGQAA
jgi:hypothetical protein